MEGFYPILAAIWLGIQTSISPCAVMMSVTAISYIGSRTKRSGIILLAGLFFVLGQILAYWGLSFLILGGFLAHADGVTRFLQEHVHRFLGPILILIGMALTGLLTFTSYGWGGTSLQKRVDSLGIGGALPLGFLYALSFCPTTAATFMIMIMLCAKQQSSFLLPFCYALGVAFPVLLFTLILAFQVHKLSRSFEFLAKVDLWTRNLTGTLLILVGIWFSFRLIRLPY